MLTPNRALRQASGADPLPSVPELSALEGWGFRARSGQVTMIAGQPGALKSTFAMWWAYRMAVPTLYFSADMDAHDAVTRLAACATGDLVESVANAVEAGVDYYEPALRGIDMSFCFDSAPTLDDIADEIAAYVTLRDSYPALIVIDNLMNVEAEMGENYAGLAMVMKETHRIARITRASVMILHHMREEGPASEIQPRSGIAGKVAQLPERILGVAFEQETGCFKFSPLKSRGGKSDPTGKQFFRLSASPERASFGPYVPQNLYYGGMQ